MRVADCALQDGLAASGRGRRMPRWRGRRHGVGVDGAGRPCSQIIPCSGPAHRTRLDQPAMINRANFSGSVNIG